MRDRFTRVLRGHIAIARAAFPDGTTGAQLDTLARQFLWHAGLDFAHGTGHGVGSYLSVHEGPARISKLGTTPLKRGMILSNEPGYYKTDAFGIRIENLELVVEAHIEGAEQPMNEFETLTLAPIDRRLINTHRISKRELKWINDYHARVRREVMPLLDDEATRIMARSGDRAADAAAIAREQPPRELQPAYSKSRRRRPLQIAGDAAVAGGDDRHRADLALYAGAGAARTRAHLRRRHLHRADDGVALHGRASPSRSSSWDQLSDKFGRRPVLLAGLGLMVIAGIGSSFALTLPQLIAARFFQALGGATGMVMSRAIIRDLYPRERVGAMISLVIAVMMIAQMLSPLAGGLLETGFGWRAIFYVVTASSLVVTLAIAFFLPRRDGAQPVT